MSDLTKKEALDLVFDQIGYLLNSLNPEEDVNKLVTLELTVNSDARDMGYLEIMTKIVLNLVDFYDSQELEDLWSQYLFLEEDDDEDYEDVA